MSPRLRCAIYTRKSSEEGLEQNFNSLDAQREACEAYILSQAGEGWSKTGGRYDDGGFSGGSMSRPGLQQLLADVERGLIDIIVVYKVDRLTRSLADFAKIIEILDAHGASFVSVTQAFNTTTSMGRLTLNVLLSFAQFEREVTAERIRDKVAASKAKGLRMGGRPPLGYDVREGRLEVNADEAERVRGIFQRYLDLGSVKVLEKDLQARCIEGKRWINKSDQPVGGGPLSRGALYYLLSNPLYRGVTRHKDKLHENTHAAVIDQALWDKVQAALAATNAHQPASKRRGDRALLEGLLSDDRGNPMVLVHTKKGTARYRYYLSRAKITGKGEAGALHRISAGLVEEFVVRQVEPHLSPSWAPGEDAPDRVRRAIRGGTLAADQMRVVLAADALPPTDAALSGDPELRFPFHMRRRQGALILSAGDGETPATLRVDRALIRGMVLAQHWARQLETGAAQSVKDIAIRAGLCEHYTARLLPLAYLAPDLVQQILEGRQPPAVSLGALTAQKMPMRWEDQRRLFGSIGLTEVKAA